MRRLDGFSDTPHLSRARLGKIVRVVNEWCLAHERVGSLITVWNTMRNAQHAALRADVKRGENA